MQMKQDEFEPTYVQHERQNANDVANDRNCIRLFNEIMFIRNFFDSYSFLQFGRNIIFLQQTNLRPFSIDLILLSVEKTLGSFETCCRLGNFSDAHMLLRKYRDDLFFYLYITLISREQPSADDIAVKNINDWIRNELSNLQISDILKYIGTSKKLSEVVKKYGFQKSFTDIAAKLNDFVHSNGISFYNNSFVHHHRKNEIQSLCDDLTNILNYITTIFVFLSALCNPFSIMSSDYTDYLDCNSTPPDDSQYWVAPFIVEFLQQKKELIDVNCIKYLQENTGMQLSEQ